MARERPKASDHGDRNDARAVERDGLPRDRRERLLAVGRDGRRLIDLNAPRLWPPLPSLGIGQDDVGRQLRLVRRHVNRAEGRAHRSVDLRAGSSVECVLRGLNSAQRHVVTAIDGAIAQGFVHPGGLHTQADLDRMKAKVAAGEHPWIDGWEKLIADPKAQNTWRPAAKAK